MKHAVNTGTPMGAYSPAIVAEGRFVYVSGQGPVRDGAYVPGTIEEETDLALSNIAAILEAAGASMGDVVRCGVFLADIADFAGMDATYRRHFPEPLPARSTVGTQLGLGMKVEIDCVAVLR
jgi:2-iminobutanoate/2-iminopropanoate deaminase